MLPTRTFPQEVTKIQAQQLDKRLRMLDDLLLKEFLYFPTFFEATHIPFIVVTLLEYHFHGVAVFHRDSTVSVQVSMSLMSFNFSLNTFCHILLSEFSTALSIATGSSMATTVKSTKQWGALPTRLNISKDCSWVVKCSTASLSPTLVLQTITMVSTSSF